MTDRDILLAIVRQVDGIEWTKNTIWQIVELLISNGYPVHDEWGQPLPAGVFVQAGDIK